MPQSFSQLSKFVVSTDYSASYRRAKQIEWQSQAVTSYSLLTSLSPGLSYSTLDGTHDLQQDSTLVIEPNVAVTIKGKQVELLHLTFAATPVIQHAVSMELIPAQSTVRFESEPIHNDSKLHTLLTDFSKELLAENPGREIVMRALIEQILVQLLRNHSQARRSDELELSRVGLIDRRIRRSVELMHAQLDQDLSLRTIASASYLSPFHFARLFKKLTGSSPHNYLAAIRANRAQQLLAETELSITQVAVRVGYLSASHFTKAFRLATGTTPREFRKGLITR
jgi:AraC family transcriptional regulator